MKKVVMTKSMRLVMTGIAGFLKRKVTKIGTGAKVDAAKNFLGRKVYVIIRKD